jgi:hypothetical protein
MHKLTDRIKRQILDEACLWWDKTGRHDIPKHLNQNTPAPMVRTGTGPIFISKAPTEQDLASGILRGLPWDGLSGREQGKVCFAYFQNVWLSKYPEMTADRMTLQ